ncbi:hypothetical protein FJTKL_04719 [Diaporthe vaccinii]|uniref:Uncharacterized protein n=1 Tax=Diaporthe vaccinii TaxID=105482 RepID=A0ABR4EZT3_9PEZI
MTKLRGQHPSLDPEWLHLCYICETGLYIYSRPTIDCTTYLPPSKLPTRTALQHCTSPQKTDRPSDHQAISRHPPSQLLAPRLPSAARRQIPKHRTISLLPTVCNNPWIASSTPTAY